MGHAPRARLNRLLGWAFLVAGFAWAVGLDPWSLSERDPALLVDSPRMAARHAQAVVLAMGFLQLAVALVLEGTAFPAKVRRAAAGLTAAGAVTYAAGYVAHMAWPAGTWLIPAGALLNFAGFLTLLWVLPRGGAPELWVVLPVFCFGMLVDAALGLFAADPGRFRPDYLGPEDGVRPRMLRLAHVAAIALPAVTLLFRDLAGRAAPGPAVRRARAALWCGTLGMPAVLVAASFTAVSVKFLLPVPALTMFGGTVVAAWLARRLARPLEFWGWLLIAASMGAGLFMGLYAFDGPAPAPALLGAYNDFVRRLSRLAHAYCIVLGLLSIFIAREPDGGHAASWPRRLSLPLLVVGSVATLLAIVLLAGGELPPDVLSGGPALVAAATALCVVPAVARA
jgi:hypothetical protein